METGRQLAVAAGAAVGAWQGHRARGQRGGAAVGLAGSPWPRAALEGGLQEAQQEGRASCQQTGSNLGRRPPQPQGGALLRPKGGCRPPAGLWTMAEGSSCRLHRHPPPISARLLCLLPTWLPPWGASSRGLERAGTGSGQFFGRGQDFQGCCHGDSWRINRQVPPLEAAL